MGFTREVAALGGKKGIAIASVASAVPSVALYWLFENLAVAIAAAAAVIVGTILLVAHEFWKQRNKIGEQLQQEKDAREATPQFRINAKLREAIDLRESLTYKSHELPKKDQRVAVGTLIMESRIVVADCAPHYLDDLNMEIVDGTGTPQLLGAINECYRVLADVRKQL